MTNPSATTFKTPGAKSVSPTAGGRPVWSWMSLTAAGGVIAILFLAGNWNAWAWLFHMWTTDADSSHGLLVPVFAAVLIWLRRDMAPADDARFSLSAGVCGTILILLASAITGFGIYTRIVTLEACAIIPCATGIILCCGGWRAMRIAWPSVLFLLFMIPLPRVVGMQLSDYLQHIATLTSTYLMQSLGMPAVAEGNIIHLSKWNLGVAEACSGIRMLVSFFAIATAICLVIRRSWWEKAILWLSAPAIAIAANVLRITAIGIAYEFGDKEFADRIFHDFAGWLMMPVGFALLWMELSFLSQIFPDGELEDELPFPLRPQLGRIP